MKATNLLKIMLLQIFVLIAVNTKAQLTSCGDLKIDSAALQKAKNFEGINGKGARPLAGNFLLRVYFHIVAYDDGTNAVTTLAILKNEFDTLRADYAGTGICFTFAGYDFVNNSYLDTNFNANTDDPNLFAPYRISSCLNIFYVQKIKGNNTACANNCGIGGTSLSIPSTICLISQNNIGPGRTISHEVGHCMGLSHTFTKAFGLENIDGSNSSTAGDQVTDTPADPYAYNGMGCFTVSGCTYNGNCPDPNGDMNFIPPYTNLMSYWLSVIPSRVCIPMLFLTPGQYSRIYGFLSTNADLLTCGTPYADYTIPPVNISTGYMFFSALNTISTSGNVILSGTVKSSISGEIIRLHPGFHTGPVTGAGRIIITATVCK
jgi:hypothetical protein